MEDEYARDLLRQLRKLRALAGHVILVQIH